MDCSGKGNCTERSELLAVKVLMTEINLIRILKGSFYWLYHCCSLWKAQNIRVIYLTASSLLSLNNGYFSQLLIVPLLFPLKSTKHGVIYLTASSLLSWSNGRDLAAEHTHFECRFDHCWAKLVTKHLLYQLCCCWLQVCNQHSWWSIHVVW